MSPLLVAATVVVGILAYLVGRATAKPTLVSQTDEEKKKVLAAAEVEAEGMRRQAALEAKELAQKARAEVDTELRTRRAEIERKAAEVAARGQAVEQRAKEAERELADLGNKEKTMAAREAAAEAVARAAAERQAEAKLRLEKVAAMSAAEARAQLLEELRDEARKQAAREVKKIEDEARAEAELRAKMVLGAAVQRYASEYVAERTVSVVHLPSDDMKGRIIGREGRNVRALEAATGIDLIIDDTPEAVVISCFNPVRREIARLALTRLIADGRIHPTRIEEMVEKAGAEIAQQCQDAGAQASFDLGIGRLHPELARLLGSLKFRMSGTQDILQHSVEVGYLAGVMAGELGLPVKVARRAGLLHDIGKAVDQEVEGSHAVVGAQAAKRHGEAPAVCRAIEVHHDDARAESVLDHIVAAANILSEQRPGARREQLESYVKRLGDLEAVATRFKGVDKAFAIQAGREVRVLVENDKVSDDEARLLAKDIARAVETELSYPGQVRVSVVRETRATDYAK